MKPNLKLLFDTESPEDPNLSQPVPASSQGSKPWEKERVVLRKGVEILDECANLSVEQRITFTWLGQSTCFIQFGGVNILTDPMFRLKLFILFGC